MDFGTEASLADYFMTGLLATVVNSDLDVLIVLSTLRTKINEQIDAELERWSTGLEPGDE